MKRLVLLGGGHAHVGVLAALAQAPLPGWQVEMVTPFARQIYSGMLPGWLAGQYSLDDCAIALKPLLWRAGVTLRQTAGVGLDLDTQCVRTADGQSLPYDLLSIDTGPMPALASLPGAREHAQPVRPIEDFVAAWPPLAQRMARSPRFRLLILGAGAAGVELAFALHARAQREVWPQLQVAICGSDELPLPGLPGSARRRTARWLAQRGITWLGGRRASRVESGQLCFEAHPAEPFDACWVVTGAAAPTWPATSGLAVDEGGFIAVGPTLQSTSHPQVLAAGDVAALTASPRPKSGVYAVRAGPVLARNLRALALGEEPTAWQPQRRALYLLNTAQDHALATWGPLVADGAWAWRWKDKIDRGFMKRFGADLAGA